MARFATNSQGKLVDALHAHPSQKYCCRECGSPVALRGGTHKQLHFYHLHTTSQCRSAGKGALHLAIQQQLIASLPKDEASLEKQFSSINRISDVAWNPKKILFEVQCSPISQEEITARNQDYRSLGYEVVWILHLNRYGKGTLSPAELALQNQPHYYTSLNTIGKGAIYQRIPLLKNRELSQWITIGPVDLSRPISYNPLSFHGDLHWELTHNHNTPLQKLLSRWQRKEKLRKTLLPLFLLYEKLLARPYRILLQLALESNCR